MKQITDGKEKYSILIYAGENNGTYVLRRVSDNALVRVRDISRFINIDDEDEEDKDLEALQEALENLIAIITVVRKNRERSVGK